MVLLQNLNLHLENSPPRTSSRGRHGSPAAGDRTPRRNSPAGCPSPPPRPERHEADQIKREQKKRRDRIGERDGGGAHPDELVDVLGGGIRHRREKERERKVGWKREGLGIRD